MEEWAPIRDFPRYLVSDHGQVMHEDLERLINPRMNQYGGVYVGLMRYGVQHARSLPLLVAHAFLDRGLDNFDTPINLNGDRFDCHVENIMWRPRAFARRYNQQFKERYPGAYDEPVRCLDTGERFPDTLRAACRYGLLESDVVASITYMTYAWPTYQQFELA